LTIAMIVSSAGRPALGERTAARSFSVSEDAQVGQALERRVLRAAPRDARDERQHRAVERALLELVLLGVEVLLAARLRGTFS